MKISKIFNNNACLVEENFYEEILLGRGIAFGKNIGDSVDESKIEKRFVFNSKDIDHRFDELMDEIPVKILSIAISIVNLAEQQLKVKLNSSVYIALADHISFAIESIFTGISSINSSKR